MLHLIFIFLHLICLIFIIPGLIITIPLHIIYAAIRASGKTRRADASDMKKCPD